ncbi:MAG: M28 family peptidase [Gemmatimonadaceae bacterium]
MPRRTLVLLALLAGACTRSGSPGSSSALPPALDAITDADLRRDLFALASDTMRGREAGTVDELRAAAWVAEWAREAGLEPAGDDGTYLQFWPMRRTQVAPSSTVAIGGTTLPMPDEAVLLTPVDARVDAPAIWVGQGRESDLAGVDVRGKVVAAILSPPDGAPPVGRELTPRRYAMLAARQRAAFLTARGALAVVLVSDSVADTQFRNIAAGWGRGTYELATPSVPAPSTTAPVAAPPPATPRAPVIWVRAAMLDRLRAPRIGAPGARVVASVTTFRSVVSSANVVARVRGTDARLRDEHVLFSAHHDGLGTRFVWSGDSIWNGADDNATTSVALLAIGRALVKAPPRRSALFVWHGAEEVGLLGSRWYVAHSTVPKASIVAVLNGDMIGRNAPDTAALLGVQPPNRTSSALAAMALEANARVGKFVIDTSWDRASHPESFFTRSDHYPYVREGIPAVYFSTLLHAEYHTPLEEASRIDIPKLARMARWIYATGWAAANADARPTFER